MKIRQLETFKAIMECGSITKAAHALNVSQPAVTKSLQLLEQTTGLRLFIRTPGGLLPTEEGRAFYLEVLRTFTGVAYLRAFAQDLKSMKRGRIIVSVIPALAESWLSGVAYDFLSTYPDISLFFHTTSSTDVAHHIVERRVDMGIAQAAFDDNQIERRRLFALDCVCILPENHRLTEKDIITAEDLDNEPFIALSPADSIRRELDIVFEKADVQVARRVEVTLGSLARELVRKGFGVSVVDSETARQGNGRGIVSRPFHPKISMDVFLLRARGRAESAFEDIFSDYCFRHAPATGN
jgi:DNA-binding transcriptional LysR family regulator